MQFYETYRAQPKLSPLVRELSWTHNLLILSRCKREEEREFYLRICHRERWGKRELERQLAGALFERTVLSPAKLSPPVTELHPAAAEVFKDTYLLDFLDLPPSHSEADLQRALVEQLKQFLIELGRDFCFIGSQYLLQVGGRDFALDLLFFNRALNCLVAFELKIDEFQPSQLGQLEFYLEALDRDVRKPHEGPAIGVLLCATKDHEVVEYALSRAVSPALVAEYASDRAIRSPCRSRRLVSNGLMPPVSVASTKLMTPAARYTSSEPFAKGLRIRRFRRSDHALGNPKMVTLLVTYRNADADSSNV